MQTRWSEPNSDAQTSLTTHKTYRHYAKIPNPKKRMKNSEHSDDGWKSKNEQEKLGQQSLNLDFTLSYWTSKITLNRFESEFLIFFSTR